MPFLAPAIPLLTTALGLGGTAGTLANLGGTIGLSLLGSHLANQNPAGAQAAITPLQAGQAQALQNAQALMPQGQSLMQNAVSAMNPALQYYQGILSGNRGQMAQTLAPEINQINQAYAAQQAAQNQLMPRGGGRAQLNQMLPYQQQQNILSLFQGLRPQAAQGMAGIGGQIGQLGGSLIGGANQSLMAATSAGQSLLNYQSQKAAQNAAANASLGQGLTSLLLPKPGSPGGGGIPAASSGMINLPTYGPMQGPVSDLGQPGFVFQNPTFGGGANLNAGVPTSPGVMAGNPLLWGGG